ncbi:hypothetical protein [Amycolatopsis sp.]|uniref:hypothetical protein n=1 Tax=Amycolatopsis sp. TaxID=37632 RepID=UPI00261B8EA6|nr:hypothetical protein [Amycolatopsis sp.]
MTAAGGFHIPGTAAGLLTPFGGGLNTANMNRGTLLVCRLHVDLRQQASAVCPGS